MSKNNPGESKAQEKPCLESGRERIRLPVDGEDGVADGGKYRRKGGFAEAGG